MHAACDRARQWATADVDGELSTFERVLLDAHLADCSACREFQGSVRGFTAMLRTAPYERLGRAIEIGRLRRRLRLRLAPAAAAMAVAVVGLGSMLASSELRTRSVSDAAARLDSVHSLASVDTMNLSTAKMLGKASSGATVRAAGRAGRSLRGGPVVHLH